MAYRHCLLASVCLLGSAAPAWAQSESGVAQDQPSASDGSSRRVGLEEIIVTARRREESAQQTPLAITAFGEETIRQQKVEQLSDLAGNVPGLTFLSAATDQFNALISLRGISTLSISENLQPSVGLYVDGIYQGFAGANLKDSFDVARIEVVKGPQGTLFGRNTTGGAINVVHNPPTSEFEGWVRLGYGNYDDRLIGGMVNIPIAGEMAALRLVGGYSGHDGYSRDVGNNRDQSDLEQINLLGALKLNPTERLELVVRGSYQRGTSNNGSVRPTYMEVGGVSNVEVAAELYGLPVFNALACAGGAPIIAAACPADLAALPGRLVAAQQAYLNSAPPKFLDSNLNRPQDNRARKYSASLTANYDLSDALQLKSITGYLRSERLTVQDLDGSPFLVGASDQDTTSRQFTQEIQLNGSVLDDRLKFTLGGYYLNTDSDELQRGQFLVVLANVESLFNSQVRTRAASLFGQATYALTDQLNFTAGLRYGSETQKLSSQNFQSSTAGGTVCTNLGHVPGTPCDATYSVNYKNLSYLAEFDYSPVQDVLLFIKTSRGYRSGGLQQAAPGYAPFRPEQVTDYEIGAKTEFADRRLRFNLSYYHQRYQNLQQTVFTTANGASINPVINAGKAKVDGVEVQFLAQPVPALTLGAQGAYTRPRYIEFFYPGLGNIKDTPFANVAKWAYSLTGDYVADLGEENSLRFHLDYRWQSKVRFNPVPTLATEGDGITYQRPFGILNGRVTLDLDRLGLEVAAYGRNLTNKKYYSFALDFAGSPAASAFGYVLGVTNAAPRTYGIEVTKRF